MPANGPYTTASDGGHGRFRGHLRTRPVRYRKVKYWTSACRPRSDLTYGLRLTSA